MSHTTAKQLEAYSFLVAFARDGRLHEHELQFIERLATRDDAIDEEEKEVLRRIFGRVNPDTVSPEVWAEVQRFSQAWQIK